MSVNPDAKELSTNSWRGDGESRTISVDVTRLYEYCGKLGKSVNMALSSVPQRDLDRRFTCFFLEIESFIRILGHSLVLMILLYPNSAALSNDGNKRFGRKGRKQGQKRDGAIEEDMV